MRMFLHGVAFEGPNHGPISEAQAEVLLIRLEGFSLRSARQREAGYLLSGLLVTPDGKPFHGDRGTYRAPGRSVQADAVEAATVKAVLDSLCSSQLVRDVAKAARAMRAPAGQDGAARGAGGLGQAPG